MSRFWKAMSGAGLLLLAAACTIERTPEEYVDPAVSDVRERDLAAEELRARLLALGGALSRSSVGGALTALAPAPDVRVLAPEADAIVHGDTALLSMFRQLVEGAAEVDVRELQLTVSPRVDVGWFAGLLHIRQADGAGAATGEDEAAGERGEIVRATGVYVLSEGSWRLVQLHLSEAAVELEEPAPASDEGTD